MTSQNAAAGAHESTPLVSSVLAKYEDEQMEEPSGAKKYRSLDFDRIVNEYSTAASLARNRNFFEKRIHEHLSSSSSHQQYRANDESKSNDDEPDPETSYQGSYGNKSDATERSRYAKLSNRGFVATRWILTMLVGICTGLTAAFILHYVEKLVEFRVRRLNREIQFIENPNNATIRWYDYTVKIFGTPGVYLGYMTFNLLLVSISTLLCVTLAPGAVSSGIPEVMSYLNGVQVGNFDSLSLYAVKVVSTIFSVASGLVIGPEGPVVHLGSILGSSITKLGDLEWALRKLRERYPSLSQYGCADLKKGDQVVRKSWISIIAFYLSHFRNDLERRNLISVGAAAGFASAFGAPVGGLLYSMEEASSFFDHAMLWKTLVGTCLATSIIAIYHGDFTKYSMLSLEIAVKEENLMARFGELPLYIIMGFLGGALGGTFNNVYEYINHKRKTFYEGVAQRSAHQRRYVAYKLLESGIVSLLTSAIMLTAPLQASWACKEIPQIQQAMATNEGSIHRYNCPEGYANEMGSILFGSREASIRDILTDPEAFEPLTLLSVGLIFLSLMIVTFGTPVPSGLFMPTVLTGSCLGGYLGIEFKRHVISSVHPSDFALIGAAAFISGMQRNVVSLCVILMEGTSQTKVIIPIIITVICARSIGDRFSEGIYEIGIGLKEYPYLDHGEKRIYDAFNAGDVMDTKFHTVKLVEKASALEALLLLAGEQQAFPVVSDEAHQYLGLIRRDQIIAALECKIYLENFGEDGNGGIKHNKISSSDTANTEKPEKSEMPKSLKTEDVAPETFSPWLRDNVCVVEHTTGRKLLFGVDETLPDGSTEVGDRTIMTTVDGKRIVSIPDEEKDYHVDIGCLMNKYPFSVGVQTPLSKAANAFATLGLRHLPVLTPGGIVAGIITREELSEEHITAMIDRKLNQAQ